MGRPSDLEAGGAWFDSRLAHVTFVWTCWEGVFIDFYTCWDRFGDTFWSGLGHFSVGFGTFFVGFGTLFAWVWDTVLLGFGTLFGRVGVTFW